TESARSQHHLGLLDYAQGDLAGARRHIERSLAIYEGHLEHTLPSLPEREQIALIGQSRLPLWLALSLPGVRDEERYRHLLAWKGLAAEAAGLRASTSRPEVRARLDRLGRLRARLNGLYYARVPPEKAGDHARELRGLNDQKAALESEV